jgi:hypothetical protein
MSLGNAPLSNAEGGDGLYPRLDDIFQSLMLRHVQAIMHPNKTSVISKDCTLLSCLSRLWSRLAYLTADALCTALKAAKRKRDVQISQNRSGLRGEARLYNSPAVNLLFRLVAGISDTGEGQ